MGFFLFENTKVILPSGLESSHMAGWGIICFLLALTATSCLAVTDSK